MISNRCHIYHNTREVSLYNVINRFRATNIGQHYNQALKLAHMLIYVINAGEPDQKSILNEYYYIPKREKILTENKTAFLVYLFICFYIN